MEYVFFHYQLLNEFIRLRIRQVFAYFKTFSQIKCQTDKILNIYKSRKRE